MLRDTWTVFWKEWREYLNVNGRRGRWSPLAFLAVFGIVMPIQTGRLWLESPISLAYFCWIPFMMGTGWAADSYAGERERHTLETLLASRLPDGAIFYGKFLTVVSYAWGMVLVSYVLSAVAVNIATWDGRVGWYPAHVLLGGAVLSLVIAILATAVGILISLKAKTVRQAQQKMSIGILLLAWGPVLLVNLLPDSWQNRLRTGAGVAASTADIESYLLPGIIGLLALLLVGNVVLLIAARRRFSRVRLIVDRG